MNNILLITIIFSLLGIIALLIIKYKNKISIIISILIEYVLTKIRIMLIVIKNNRTYEISLICLVVLMFIIDNKYTDIIKVILIIILLNVFIYNTSDNICKSDYDLTLKTVRLMTVALSSIIMLISILIFSTMLNLTLIKITLLATINTLLLLIYKYININKINIEERMKKMYGYDTFYSIFHKNIYIYVTCICCLCYIFLVFLGECSIMVKLVLMCNLCYCYLAYIDVIYYLYEKDTDGIIRSKYVLFLHTKRYYCDGPLDDVRKLAKDYVPKRKGPLVLSIAFVGCTGLALGASLIHDHYIKTMAMERAKGIATSHYNNYKSFINDLPSVKDKDVRAIMMQSIKDEYEMYRNNMGIATDMNRGEGTSDGFFTRISNYLKNSRK